MQALLTPSETCSGESWYVSPAVQGVQVMFDDVLAATEKNVPTGHSEDHGLQPVPLPYKSQPVLLK